MKKTNRKPRNPNTREYSDTFVTVFNDLDKMFVLFVNDKGHTKVVNVDSNFFYVESLVETYYDMLFDSFCNWGIEDSKKERKEYVKKFIKHLERKCEIDPEVFSEGLKKLLK